MKKILIVILFFGLIGLNAEKLYEAKTSGVLIKDSLEVHAIDDIDTKGSVVCYFTLPKRSL